jgi:tetratricopeptide (TPR) repeat protein
MNFKFSSLATGLALAGLLSFNPAATANDTPPPSAVAPLPAQELTPDLLFMMLLGEIAGARGEIGVAVEAYMELARRTRDPRIARRATEIALFAQDIESATEAARLWADSDPASDEAQRVLAGILASGGERLNEVQIQLARILANAPEQLEQNLLGLNRALARVPNRETVRAIVNRLTEPYLNQPAAHFARAQAALSVQDGIAALTALERALELRPDWEPAVLFKAQLLVQFDTAQAAVRLLRSFLDSHPDNAQARLAYARSLVSARDFAAARAQFQQLLDANPGDADLMFAVALTSSQIADYDTAERLFTQALEAGHPDADSIRMNLGYIAEQRQRTDEAIRWYRTVQSSSQYLDAQIRIAIALANDGRIDEARAHLDALPVDGADRQRVLLTETLILREAGRYAEALELVDDALRNDPENGELLYESAMLAERLDRLNVMEARLRKLIALEPDHAHAYNALGYTLADRGLRLDEAEALIQRALELAPDDPFILDSLGWLRFRQNDLEGALIHLERAYDLRADPEIAAHLGEVLWRLERHDEANRLWDEALREHPDNRTLNDTVRRLRAQ